MSESHLQQAYLGGHLTDGIVAMAKLARNSLHTEMVKRQQQQMHPNAFRAQFGSIKIRLQRRAGHTTAALLLLMEHKDAMLFTRSSAEMHYLMEDMRKYIIDNNIIEDMYRRIYPVGHRQLPTSPTSSRSFVIFDRFSDMPETDINRIQNLYSNTEMMVYLQ